jgi:ubiquinone/menaquinone biosynthesis C-methylase UbiE
MVERAGVQDGDRVFDLGIGTGNSALRLTGPGIELWGMDLSRRMLDVAASRLPDAHLVCAGVFRLVPATTG